MAQASIQQPSIRLVRTDAPTPTDERVAQIYAFERSQQERGAISRTSRALSCSPTHVKNVLVRLGVLERKTPQKPAETVDSIEYVPPPNANPEPIAPLLCKAEPKQPETPAPFEMPTPEVGPSVSIPLMPLFQTIDVQFGDPSIRPVSNTYRHDEAEMVLCVALTVALVMTTAAILLASKSLPLSLALFVPTMLAWRAASQAAQAWHE